MKQGCVIILRKCLTGKKVIKMVVTNKTIITFFLPREYALSVKFKAQHPDWIENQWPSFIEFERQDTYAVEPNKEGDQDD